ncbi:uncharacterized protein LOC127278519 [Leptopilina boulardi]|uniref:uncharacterized protein LOC127278519 n=1 Tax=Leptopilina boulardi TaxID=63433 RepID=UPI0021F63B50|nr:uncharacterized protein LOC127278519 [Leptopilina boulardi]
MAEQIDNRSVSCCEMECHFENKDVLESDTNDSSQSDDSFISDSENADDVSGDEMSTVEDTDIDFNNGCNAGKSLQDKIRSWALLFHISLVALTALLLIFQSVVKFPLPSDARTLLGTLRNVKISQMSNGKYHHFGVERAVRAILQEFRRKGKTLDQIKLVFNIDGLPISNSGTDSLWLILCSEINGDEVYPVGAFYGKTKPDDANEFMHEFTQELIHLCENGFDDADNVLISCECIVCDAPAKSFAFYLKGHTGYSSCSKCEYYLYPEK